MLDFEKLDQGLEQAVGIAPCPLLEAAAPGAVSRFVLAREQWSELTELTAPTEPERLERDRLTSTLGSAYGDRGLLAQAGAAFTVARRLERLGGAVAAVAEDPVALHRLERESAILGMLTRHRLDAPPQDTDRALTERLEAARAALADLAEVSLALSQATRSAGVAKSTGRLYGVADLTNVASDFEEGLSLPGVISFVLGRLADSRFTGEADALLDELCRAHAAQLRGALWAWAEASFAGRAPPPMLTEIQELDLALERVAQSLRGPERSADARAQAVRALYTLLALGRIQSAAAAARRRLTVAIALVVEGLDAEPKS